MGNDNGFRVSTSEVATALGAAGATGFSFQRMATQARARNVARDTAQAETILAERHAMFIAFQNGSATPPVNHEAHVFYYENEFPAQEIKDRLSNIPAEKRAALNCSNPLVNEMIQNGDFNWKVFDDPKMALQAITENPAFLEIVTGVPLATLQHNASQRCPWSEIPSDLANTKRIDAEGRQRSQLRLMADYEASATRWLWATRVSGSVTAIFLVADVGTHFLCSGRSVFQIAFTDQKCE